MCSPTTFVLILIATLIWNCLHFGCAVHTASSSSSSSNGSDNNRSNTNNLNDGNSGWHHKNHNSNQNHRVTNTISHDHDVSVGRSANDRDVNDGSKRSRGITVAKTSNNKNINNDAVGGRRLRIDLTRKHIVHLNGVEVDEDSLPDHLEEHERELIFGNTGTRRSLKLVHLQHLTDANNAAAAAPALPTTNQQKYAHQHYIAHKSSHRVKRSDTSVTDAPAAAAATNFERQSGTEPRAEAASQSEEIVSVQIKDNEQSVHLQLRQTQKLIDDAFVFIRRYANSTQFIEDSHKLAERYKRCFYSNENSALDLCDDENVRGVFHHNSTNYILHPLPSRFGNSTHILLESKYNLPPKDLKESTFMPLQASIFNTSLYFEPEEADFTDYEPNEEITKEVLTQNYTNHHTGREEKPTRFVELNLRYKPRYHHTIDHHQHHRQQQNRRQPHLRYQRHQQQKQQTNNNRQLHKRQRKQKEHHHKESPLLQHNDLTYNSYSQNNNNNNNNNENENESQPYKNFQHDDNQQHDRHRRFIASGKSKIPQDLYIETAIFVDRDLFNHMTKNFPDNTESQLMRFVLAMINAVQLLYHERSLGRRINFVLKRLEILYNDPPKLRRSNDIDTYLSNFCEWQQSLNPPKDSNTMHYDHALILTGLDLYVVDKSGKKINQVVGLAPVAGMCTNTSSCTINEGKHFESVFVVAHEIGHNLGMRHDNANERNCDPTRYIMSPTLGSGKTTWSDCSRDYLEKFLAKGLGSCLFDHGQFANNLDHNAEGILPGERFDADQQCMLKYGRNSSRSKNQKHADICTDLHCQRDRYTWTSHPALEGTECGKNMWCRSGNCVTRPTSESTHHTKSGSNIAKRGYDKGSFLESSKMGHLLHEYNYNKPISWSEWSEGSECASGCLYGPSRRLLEGSTGLRTYSRRCIDPRKRCLGRDHKYESCIAKECYSLKTVETINDFANDKCTRAKKLDADFTGEGVQIIGDMEESCKIFCRTKSNGTKMRRWPFPDGTTCRSKLYKPEDISFCVDGRCEKFSCDNSTQNYYKLDPYFCKQRNPPTRAEADESRRYNSVLNEQGPTSAGSGGNSINYKTYNSNNNIPSYKIYAPTTYRSKYENEVALRSFHGQEREQPYKRKADVYQPWNKYNYSVRDSAQPVAQPQPPKPPPPVSASLVAVESAVAPESSEWIVKSGCHSSCMAKSKGIQVVTSRLTGTNNIQLCTHNAKPCERLLTATEHAEHTCARYKLKVRGLSGYGTQIAASVDEPDRSCRVGCQDEFIKYRFYLVNGRYGHFPLGTKCSNTDERYCVNGKCLEFGPDNIPLQQSHISLALFRSRRSLSTQQSLANEKNIKNGGRKRRSYISFDPVNITETITQDFINKIVSSIMEIEKQTIEDDLLMQDHIEFSNPIHLAMDESN